MQRFLTLIMPVWSLRESVFMLVVCTSYFVLRIIDWSLPGHTVVHVLIALTVFAMLLMLVGGYLRKAGPR